MLSPFCDDLPEFDSEGPEFPPVEELNCDPYSPAYMDAIFQALDLDGLVYFNVDVDIMKQFKELICQYPSAFLLPGSPLRAVKGFEHRIDTGDAQPSRSEWDSPCILVRKPPEKGQLQPPRFVVDYRRLNSVTQGDSYAIPSISIVLDAVSQGKVMIQSSSEA